MSNDSPQENMLDQLLTKLAASKFLTISVLLHLVLVIASGSFVLYKAAEERAAMGVPGDMEFLNEGTSEVQAPPREESAPSPQLEQVTETVPAVSEVATPVVSSTNISSALDSALTTSATTASFQITSNPAAASPASLTQNLATDVSSVSQAIERAGKVAPLAGAASNVAFFGIKEKGRRVALILDASPSMVFKNRGGKEAYDKLKAELVDMVNKLQPSTEFNVFVFENDVDRFKPGAVPATGDIKSEFKRWIAPYMEKETGVRLKNYTSDRLAGFRGTSRMDAALTGAFEMGADVIFVLSDGVPSVRRPPTEKELAEWQEIADDNKEEIDEWREERDAYYEKYGEIIKEMRAELAERNKSVKNRTSERQHWIEGYKGIPPRPEGKAPRGTWKPNPGFSREELSEMLDELVQELYIPAGIDRPSINIVGYAVEDDDRDWLKDMARSFKGKYRDFD